MKNIYIILIWVISLHAITANCFAQSDVTIDDLRSSTAPAFNIIGVEPKSVSRPTTPKAVATNLVSALNQNGFKPDISIEAAPYWIKQKRNLTFTEYLNPSTGQSFWQTLSVSLATKQGASNNNSQQGTQVGIGVRFQLIPGRPSKNSKVLINAINVENLFAALLNTGISAVDRNGIISAVRLNIPKIIDGSIPLQGLPNGILPTDVQTYVRNNKTEIENTLVKLINKEEQKTGESISTYIARLKSDNLLKNTQPLQLQESLKYRVGWILEISAADAFSTSTNNVENIRNNKAGIWTNLTYRTDDQRNEFTFLSRFTGSYRDSVLSNQDFGVGYTHNIKDFSVSLESIIRFYQVESNDTNLQGLPIRKIEKSNTYRIALNLDYKVSDTVSLNATFGKNYKNDFFASGNLLALIGVNFGISNKQTLPIQ